MFALSKYAFLFICTLFLAGCSFFEEDDKKSSASSLLPDINTILSTESPVGIWMLEISADSFESFYTTDFEEHSTDYSSNYHAYKFLRIENDPVEENSFLINDCYYSFRGMPTIFTGWQLVNSTLLSPAVDVEEDDNGLFTITSSSQGELTLVNNLQLSGTQKSSFGVSFASSLDTGDPLALPDFTIWQAMADILFPKTSSSNLSIKGVKVSDETIFSQASELDIQLNISSNTSGTSIDASQIECISSTTKTRKTFTNNPETEIAESIESSNDFNAYFINDTFVNIENLTQEDTISNTIILELDEAESWSFIKYSSNCLEGENCEHLSFFEQSSSLNTKGHLSTSIEYATDTEINVQATLSIHVK